MCNDRRNYAALEFHHTDPVQKLFQLDMRSLANPDAGFAVELE